MDVHDTGNGNVNARQKLAKSLDHDLPFTCDRGRAVCVRGQLERLRAGEHLPGAARYGLSDRTCRLLLEVPDAV